MLSYIQGGVFEARVVGDLTSRFDVFLRIVSPYSDVDPGNINLVVNINDVFAVVTAFGGNPYPFGPADADGHCP